MRSSERPPARITSYNVCYTKLLRVKVELEDGAVVCRAVEGVANANALLPSLSTTSASMPKNGLVADPGFSGTHGSGVIRIEPVSVCHQVSMIGLSPPAARWNHSQASGLIGSPTLPKMRKPDRSYSYNFV